MRRLLRGVGVACCLALAGCVTVPDGQGVAIGDLSAVAEAAATATLQAREQRLKALPALSFSGRVALSGGSRGGGTGRIEWQQAGDRYRVTLGAPVDRKSVWEGTRVSVRGDLGGPRSSK